jgi:ubiquinone/menaquinone biosynthesis C-methylase UbiE
MRSDGLNHVAPQVARPITADSSRESATGCTPWEEAYLRFETPEQEVKKFVKRLRRLRVRELPRDAKVVELFCGRGNGLIALQRMGFSNIEGVDLSAKLIAQYRGSGKVLVGDCRKLPFANQSKDLLIVQGGLHHLMVLPDHLEQTLAEMQRVLREGGRLVVVEPWRTPFLTLAHVISEIKLVRRVSNKMDALATMTHYERDTYERWLGQPEMILRCVAARFTTIQQWFAWGKWNFVGTPL